MRVFHETFRVSDGVENWGFRPTPHAIFYHINFGYRFTSEDTEISGNMSLALNADNKRLRDDFKDSYEAVPVKTRPSHR